MTRAPLAKARPLRVSSSTLSYLIGAATTLLWTGVAFLFRDEMYDNLAIVASSVVLGAAIAFLRWQPSPGREGLRLLGLFVTGQAFVSSGLGVLIPVDASMLQSQPTSDAFSFAALSTVVFSLMFLAGAALTAPKGGTHLAHPLTPAVTPTRRFAIALAAISSAAILGTTVLKITSLGTLPLVIFNMSLIVPMLTGLHLSTSSKSRLPLVLIGAAQALNMFYSSMLGAFIVTVRDMLLATIHLRKKLPWLLIGGTIALAALLNPAKSIFRASLLDQGQAARTAQPFERTFLLWQDALSTTWSDEGRASRPDGRPGIQATIQRLNYNDMSAHIYTVVPSRLPYEWGGTYADIPMVLVPRVIYPDKPVADSYTRGRWLIRLGLQTRETVQQTAIAIPMPAEAYWNFGWPGVFGVALLLGMAVGAMLRLAPRHAVARTGYIVLLVTTLGQFLDMMVWLIPQFVVVALSIMIAEVFCRIGAPGSARAASPSAAATQFTGSTQSAQIRLRADTRAH